MEKIKFGPSGNSQIFYDEGNKHSIDAPKWLRSKGLDAYEYSFGKGYTMGMEMAQKIGEQAIKYDISVSVHAPYYINFANLDQEMVEKSYDYVIKGLNYLNAMKGQHLVVHLSSCGKLDRLATYELTQKRLRECVRRCEDLGLLETMYICPETMGKSMQFGTFKEIIDICTISEKLIPTFDFGHINSITQGGLKTKDDFKAIFNYCFEKLGEFRTKNCHIHFSKIEYGAKGELRHLNLDDKIYGPEFGPLADIIIEYGLTPTIICESKDFMAEDALLMKQIYEQKLE